MPPKSLSAKIISLEQQRINEAGDILANAFDKDTVFSYFAPENQQKKQKAMQELFRAALRYLQNYEHIYTTTITTGELKGIAAWIPPGQPQDNIFRMIQAGFLSLPWYFGIKKIRQMTSVFSLIEERRKQDMSQPHWYLSLLGVASDYQGQGLGSVLLRPILEKADRDGLPCYLETSTEDAVRFYKRQGFEILWNKEVEVPGSSLKLWTMKREAV